MVNLSVVDFCVFFFFLLFHWIFPLFVSLSYICASVWKISAEWRFFSCFWKIWTNHLVLIGLVSCGKISNCLADCCFQLGSPSILPWRKFFLSCGTLLSFWLEKDFSFILYFQYFFLSFVWLKILKKRVGLRSILNIYFNWGNIPSCCLTFNMPGVLSSKLCDVRIYYN